MDINEPNHPNRHGGRGVTSSLLLVLAVVLALAAAACGSSGGSPSASPGSGAKGGGAGDTTATTGQPGGTGTKGKPVAVCDVFPATTAAQMSAEPITKATEDDTPSIGLYACSYASTDGTQGFRLSVLRNVTKAAFDATGSASSAKPVSGLGDAAHRSILGLQVLFGDTQVDVSNLSDDRAATAIANAMHAKV